MYKQGVPSFKYYVGIDNLAKVATREDRVCVLNILGGESSDVTPVSHAFSGGNVVFGTSPGRGGQKLKTPIGDVPVFNSVREGLNAGHRFNTGVVYLPPPAVRDGVAELVRVNPDLEKIIIITEKVSVHDAREIRAIGQMNGIDIFGGNGLGVADAWNRVRIGGALGGDNPGETLLKGSVAIFSNSGNFTTTIANYLATAGWGTTTSISSGKDVYIHFAAPEFVHAFGQDERSKAAVLYAEPGGYYELGLQPTKPIVACVVGRWKAKLTRAVGHAGAMAGSGDDAASKERWFMEMFGVDDIFTPHDQVCSAKGAVVTNIAHIPAALTAVMRLGGIEPDFAPRGNLSLKPWFGNSQGLKLPPELELPVVDVAGLSMGGMWAQHALIDDAESRRFRCSLLIGSGAHITPRMRSVMLGLRSMWQHDIPRIDSWRIFQALLFSAEFLDRPSTIPLLELLANDSRTSRQAALCQLDAVLAHDPGEGLAMIHGVRCVLGGQLDVLMPPSTQSELAHALGGVPMEILPGAGHAVWLEQPTALARLMQAALPE